MPSSEYPVRIHSAGQAATERLCGAVKPHDALRMVVPISLGDLEELRLYATDWMWLHNLERSNIALGGAHTQAAAGYGRVNLLLSSMHFGAITKVNKYVE